MQARIYKPAKNPMQSGEAQDQWVLEIIPALGTQFMEPLMGRTSSKDMMNEVRIQFDNKEQAILFAESKQYQYEVITPKAKKLIKRAYASNFK